MHEIDNENTKSAEESQQNTLQLATLTMLARIYDVQMHILKEMNAEAAERVWDFHNRGGSYNPSLIVMELSKEEDLDG